MTTYECNTPWHKGMAYSFATRGAMKELLRGSTRETLITPKIWDLWAYFCEEDAKDASIKTHRYRLDSKGLDDAGHSTTLHRWLCSIDEFAFTTRLHWFQAAIFSWMNRE